MTPMPSAELYCPQLSITLKNLLSHPWNHYPLFMPREVLCDVMMEATVLAWGPNESQCHSPRRSERWAGRLVMRPPVPRTSLIFFNYLLEHFPGLVAIMGMPLHCLPYDHGRLDLDETPYPPSAKS